MPKKVKNPIIKSALFSESTKSESIRKYHEFLNIKRIKKIMKYQEVQENNEFIIQVTYI